MPTDKARSSNPWVRHVQTYRSTRKCSFKEALKRSGPSYRAWTVPLERFGEISSISTKRHYEDYISNMNMLRNYLKRQDVRLNGLESFELDQQNELWLHLEDGTRIPLKGQKFYSLKQLLKEMAQSAR